MTSLAGAFAGEAGRGNTAGGIILAVGVAMFMIAVVLKCFRDGWWK